MVLAGVDITVEQPFSLFIEGSVGGEFSSIKIKHDEMGGNPAVLQPFSIFEFIGRDACAGSEIYNVGFVPGHFGHLPALSDFIVVIAFVPVWVVVLTCVSFHLLTILVKNS